VFVNGVEQREGEDYTVAEGYIVFNRSLAQEGRLGFWRWALIALGIAGTYRKHENVDVQHTLNGRPTVATGLKVETEKADAS
jgi:anti-sigma-K factor RskA